MMIKYEPIVRLMMVVFPVLFAARTLVTASWSAPSGPYPLDQTPWFQVIYYSATVTYLYWATIIHKHPKRSTYIGMTLGMVCMYRAITVAEARRTFGPVAYSAVVNWATFSLATLLIMTLSLQYIMASRIAEEGLIPGLEHLTEDLER